MIYPGEKEEQPVIPRGRLVGVSIFICCALAGFSVLIYRDMTRDIPPFSQLESVKSADLDFRAVNRRGTDSFLFEMRGGGKRLFTEYMDRGKAEKIQEALSSGRALVYAGEWDTPFPGKDIRSVFHIELDGNALLDYKSLVAERERDKRHVWLLIAGFNALVIGVVALVALKPSSIALLLKMGRGGRALGR